MEAAIKYAIDQPEVQARCKDTLQAKIIWQDGASYKALCKEYTAIWGEVLKLVNLKKF